MRLSLMLGAYPTRLWALGRQMGVTNGVGTLPRDERGQRGFDYMPLLHMKNRFEDAGLTLAVIESAPPLNNAKLGVEGRDEEIENFCTLIRNMGAIGVPVLCWNWMAQFSWVRTSTTTRTRGGALVTSYDHSATVDAPLTEAGAVSEDRLWENLRYFLRKVVPVAEEASVKLALHPDDPPISPIRGISRIIRTPDALEEAMKLVPSEYNGITFCQGTIAEMGVDIPETIRRFGELGVIHFAHFRDVRGTAERFEETFHDDGQTDMFAAMRTYREIGFDGPMRPDHAPTMEGESNDHPGYETLGRLFAIGYMKGLLEGAAAVT